MVTTRVMGPGGSSKTPADDEFLQQLYRGGELLAAGKVIEAKDFLERAHRLRPDNEKGQNLLGLAYFKLGLFDRAAEIYEMLVRGNPVDPTLRVNLGLVYLKTNALQRAVREFETATDMAPEHKKAHNYLGLALAQLGEYGRAREHFLRAGSDAMAEKMSRAIAGEGFTRPPAEQPATARGFAEIEGTDVLREQGGELLVAEVAQQEAPEAQERAHDGAATPPAPTSVPATPPPTPLPRQALPPAEGDWGAQFGFDDTPRSRPAPGKAPATVVAASALKAAAQVAPPPPRSSMSLPAIGAVPPAAAAAPKPSAPVSAEVVPAQRLSPQTDIFAAVTVPAQQPSTAPASTPFEELRFAEDEGPSFSSDATPVLTAVPEDEELPESPEAAAHEDLSESSFEETSSALASSVPLTPWDDTPATDEASARAEAGHDGMGWRHDISVPLLRELTPSLALAGASRTSPFLAGLGSFSVLVDGELLTRLEGLVAFSGKLEFRPEMRRARGRATDKPFGEGPRRMVRASGRGVLYMEPAEGRTFFAMDLGEETAYLRDAYVFAFEEPVMFENGKVPSDVAHDLELVNLRGQGKVLLSLPGALRSLPVRPEEAVSVPLTHLVGWQGSLSARVVPVLKGPGGEGLPPVVELSGEGFALIALPVR